MTIPDPLLNCDPQLLSLRTQAMFLRCSAFLLIFVCLRLNTAVFFLQPQAPDGGGLLHQLAITNLQELANAMRWGSELEQDEARAKYQIFSIQTSNLQLTDLEGVRMGEDLVTLGFTEKTDDADHENCKDQD
jgi:hypothetical protein